MLRRTVNANYRPENRYKINNSRVFIKTKLLTGRWIKGFEAAKSAIIIPEGKRQRQCLGAAIFHGNRLLSTGYNLYTKTTRTFNRKVSYETGYIEKGVFYSTGYYQ